jgi:hypothetical protein
MGAAAMSERGMVWADIIKEGFDRIEAALIAVRDEVEHRNSMITRLDAWQDKEAQRARLRAWVKEQTG